MSNVTALGEVDQRQGCTFVLSPECLQQRLGLLEVSRLKALGEPAVDGCQQRTRLGLLALLLPHACQAHDGPQLLRRAVQAATLGVAEEAIFQGSRSCSRFTRWAAVRAMTWRRWASGSTPLSVAVRISV